MIWNPLLLSLRVATLATALVTLVGLALALWLARSDFQGKSIVETMVSLPMILPPSVVGYYLLLFLGRSGPLFFLGIRIVFTWPAAVIASAVVALPLMVQSSRAAIAAVDPALEKAAGTLGSPPWKVVWDVTPRAARHTGRCHAGLRPQPWGVRRYTDGRWQHTWPHADTAAGDL